jgi:hypothetical protein
VRVRKKADVGRGYMHVSNLLSSFLTKVQRMSDSNLTSE